MMKKQNPLKTYILNSLSAFILLCFLFACSTKRDNLLSRNSHALSTQYNILYNGQIGLDKGLTGIESNDKDNFWHRLPIEKMQFNDELANSNKANPDFEVAEKKATKAIQKHSMNIDGRERNYKIDESYLLLGKSRYYSQRFVPALDAFNYILYKYPNSSKIYEAKVWREKTNMRLGNDALVINNMKRLLGDQKLKKQIFSDANALLAEAYLNIEEKDSAVTKLILAEKNTKNNLLRARYRFILGQLQEELGNKDKALESYESVIAMNRKSERKYVIQSQARKAQLFDFKNGDTIVFLKTFDKLLNDRENRPFLDVLNHQMGLFYDKQDNQKQALWYYNNSLKKATTDEYLTASNYRNIADMNFRKAKYPLAAKYYDSTLTKLNSKTREFIHIDKVRKDLGEVILYEEIASRNDSIIKLVSMSNDDRTAYFNDYIVKLKKEDEEKRIKEEKRLEVLKNIERNTNATVDNGAITDQNGDIPKPKKSILPPSLGANTASTVFYFYNPTTVSYGKLAFKSSWGSRKLNGNWRFASATEGPIATIDKNVEATVDTQFKDINEEVIAEYTTDFYIQQLPTKKAEIDSIAKERNLAYYQLGIIYKEKFKEYKLATDKLEQLLRQNPEDKLIPPTMYNLFKIYQITNNPKASEIKNQITTQFPDSRYAQILNNTNSSEDINDTPDGIYQKLYAMYLDENYEDVFKKTDVLINQLSGEEIVSKLELLRATTIGKLKGLAEYKKALQYVADNYPNTEEGKKSVEIVSQQIPILENLNFSYGESKNWKILYKLSNLEESKAKIIEGKIKKFIAVENIQKLGLTYERYKENEKFLIIQGAKSEEYAKNISTLLKDNKEYKIEVPAIVLSTENYKVVQIKKNLEDYLVTKKQ